MSKDYLYERDPNKDRQLLREAVTRLEDIYSKAANLHNLLYVSGHIEYEPYSKQLVTETRYLLEKLRGELNA